MVSSPFSFPPLPPSFPRSARSVRSRRLHYYDFRLQRSILFSPPFFVRPWRKSFSSRRLGNGESGGERERERRRFSIPVFPEDEVFFFLDRSIAMGVKFPLFLSLSSLALAVQSRVPRKRKKNDQRRRREVQGRNRLRIHDDSKPRVALLASDEMGEFKSRDIRGRGPRFIRAIWPIHGVCRGKDWGISTSQAQKGGEGGFYGCIDKSSRGSSFFTL
jgi:hypothetical protein